MSYLTETSPQTIEMVIDLSAYISYKMKGCAGFKIKMACLFQDNLYVSLPQR